MSSMYRIGFGLFLLTGCGDKSPIVPVDTGNPCPDGYTYFDDGVCRPEESRPGQVTCRRSQQSLETLLE